MKEHDMAIVTSGFSLRPLLLRPVYTGDFCRGNSMRFLWRQSCNLKIARVNQVRFSVRFVAAISQGFRACLKLDATKIASSCRDKNRLCKRAFSDFS